MQLRRITKGDITKLINNSSGNGRSATANRLLSGDMTSFESGPYEVIQSETSTAYYDAATGPVGVAMPNLVAANGLRPAKRKMPYNLFHFFSIAALCRFIRYKIGCHLQTQSNHWHSIRGSQNWAKDENPTHRAPGLLLHQWHVVNSASKNSQATIDAHSTASRWYG